MSESTEAAIQMSLCIPSLADSGQLLEFAADVSSFFAKFPIQYEVLLAAPRSRILPELPANFRVVPIKNANAKAKNLVALFAEARGEYLIASEIELAIPLSECFKILQVFFADPATDAVFGDRTQKKKKLENTKYDVHLNKTESFFNGIIHDKTNWKFEDPFCPVFALKKSTFEMLKPDIAAIGWHLTPEIQRLVQKKNLTGVEIPLYAGSRMSSKNSSGAPALTEILGLLRFVLFRI
ncbi:MAG: hypothetical protein H7326_05250 [Bdellovibrionaceae bacterium]|nr:hypothetical protein [Pseudobdellovibrionaceae bacterium]